MKFILIAVIFISCSVNSQITEAKKVEPRNVIGKVGGLAIFAELYYQIEGEDTAFTLMYKNNEYSTLVDINSISFKGGMATVGILYSNMTSVFSSENKKNKEFKVEFTLGEAAVIIVNERAMGMNYMKFFTSDGYFILNQKQVDKLFGK